MTASFHCVFFFFLTHVPSKLSLAIDNPGSEVTYGNHTRCVIVLGSPGKGHVCKRAPFFRGWSCDPSSL